MEIFDLSISNSMAFNTAHGEGHEKQREDALVRLCSTVSKDCIKQILIQTNLLNIMVKILNMYDKANYPRDDMRSPYKHT